LAECDTSGGCEKNGKKIKDLSEDLNKKIRATIANRGAKSPVDAVHDAWGAYPISQVEQWIEKKENADSRIDVPLAKSKYAGAEKCGSLAIASMWRLEVIRPGTVLSPSVLVCGLCIGADKLGHFFSEGWQYYWVSVLQKKGDAYADAWGQFSEGSDPAPQGPNAAATKAEMLKYIGQAYPQMPKGVNGLATTGVYSYGDLAANHSGMQMYKDLAAGKEFDICNYVKKDASRLENWSEEINPSTYDPALDAVVKANAANNAKNK
jgi:hypothetical protein